MKRYKKQTTESMQFTCPVREMKFPYNDRRYHANIPIHTQSGRKLVRALNPVRNVCARIAACCGAFARTQSALNMHITFPELHTRLLTWRPDMKHTDVESHSRNPAVRPRCPEPHGMPGAVLVVVSRVCGVPSDSARPAVQSTLHM